MGTGEPLAWWRCEVISKDTADWLRSLPHPDDKEGWRERERALFRHVLSGIEQPDEPLPWDGMEEVA